MGDKLSERQVVLLRLEPDAYEQIVNFAYENHVGMNLEIHRAIDYWLSLPRLEREQALANLPTRRGR